MRRSVDSGDEVFCYAPDGRDARVPAEQPLATVATKDHPGEPHSGVGRGVFPVDVDAGRRSQPPADDPGRHDEISAQTIGQRHICRPQTNCRDCVCGSWDAAPVAAEDEVLAAARDAG